jgi:hypothetical protein
MGKKPVTELSVCTWGLAKRFASRNLANVMKESVGLNASRKPIG